MKFQYLYDKLTVPIICSYELHNTGIYLQLWNLFALNFVPTTSNCNKISTRASITKWPFKKMKLKKLIRNIVNQYNNVSKNSFCVKNSLEFIKDFLRMFAHYLLMHPFHKHWNILNYFKITHSPLMKWTKFCHTKLSTDWRQFSWTPSY